jgi:hypothetical protein
MKQLEDSQCKIDIICACCDQQDPDIKDLAVNKGANGWAAPNLAVLCIERITKEMILDVLYEEISHVASKCGALLYPEGGPPEYKRNPDKEFDLNEVTNAHRSRCICKEIQAKTGSPNLQHIQGDALKEFISRSSVDSCVKNKPVSENEYQALVNEAKNMYENCSKRVWKK